MGLSWGHTARRMSAAEIDLDDRWGYICTYNKKCQGQATIVVSYQYRTGRTGRIAQAGKRYCTSHGEELAATHSVAIEPADPPRNHTRAVTVTPPHHQPRACTVAVRPDGRRWQVTESCAGMNVGTFWIDQPATAGLRADVLPLTETEMARKHRLVTTGAWRIDGQTATVTAALAEDTPAWADKPWILAVREDPGRFERDLPCWEAFLMLAPRFALITHPLGTHNMNLSRAIRTATAELGHTWQIGTWTLAGDTATCLAHRKATPTSD